MKIAVYTICKNEEQFIKRWYESCKNADSIILVDTGSTDNSVELAESLGIEVHHLKLDPWRFDDARNFSLHCVPQDIDVCVCLDLDEILVKNWRHLIENNWDLFTDRLRYTYIWNWVNGKPGVTYHADKVHKRYGFRWVNPVHEVLHKDARLGPEHQTFIDEVLIEHHADNTKSRSQYLDLLALSVKENPTDDRSAHYYARDLMYAGRYQEAIDEFMRHLNLPTATWKAERAASYRYAGDCFFALGNYHKASELFCLAIEEEPNVREGYIALAQLARFIGEWKTVKTCCEQALAITDKPSTYINSPDAWSDWPVKMLEEANGYIKNT